MKLSKRRAPLSFFAMLPLIGIFGLAELRHAGAQANRRPAMADPFAPTHGVKSAEEIDREWQASVAKYDAPRAAILAEVDRQAHDGPYRPDWETLRNRNIPQWYQDAKFGIFIHWGVYSVPASQNEWYPRNMYQQGDPAFAEHVRRFGPQDRFGYKDFIPMFKAEKWNPSDWARLFKQAGARYVIPVAEHHDGFAMYESQLSDWTAAKMGPRRDVIGELAKAVRAEGLHFGTSFHRAEHDWFFDGGRAFPSDVNDPRYASLYGPAHAWLSDPHQMLLNDWTYVSPRYVNDWLARAAEIARKYHPEVMYFDWWAGQPNFRPAVTKFAAFYYNLAAAQKFPAVMDIKGYDLEWTSGARDFERGMRADIEPRHFQTDTSISNRSWGYIEHDQFKTPDFIVHQLVDIVSKNGNLLLNVGPRSDGTIPETVRGALLAIGGWLAQNGEAIYGTAPWKIYGEGPTKVQAGFGRDVNAKGFTAQDFRFTATGDALYAIEMAWPADGKAVIHALGSNSPPARGLQILSVELLGAGGSPRKIGWSQTAEGLALTLPSAPPGQFAYAFRIRTRQAK